MTGPESPEFRNKLAEHISHYLEHEDKLATSIGKIVITLNSIEKNLASTLSYMISDNHTCSRHTAKEIPAIFNASLSYSQKLDLFAALFEVRFQSFVNLSRLARWYIWDMGRFEEFRNTVVHSYWRPVFLMEDSDSQIIREKATIKGRKGLRLVEEDFDDSVLTEMLNQMKTFTLNEAYLMYAYCRDAQEIPDEVIVMLHLSRQKRLQSWPFKNENPPSNLD